MNKTASFFQIQPRFAEREIWAAAAEREDLQYEVLELSGPPVLNKNGRLDVFFDWYRKSGRVRSVHGCFIDINPASADSLLRELSIKRLHESCRLAQSLGAQNVVFHSTCEPFLRGGYLEAWASRSAECYAELAETYEDLHIFIENSMDVDPDPLRELMRHTGHPRVRVCLDVGHANYSRAPLEKWFYDLGEWIGYMHLSDNNGFFDEHLPIGQGSVDWEKADRFWRSLGGEIPLTLEINDIESVSPALSFFREHSFFGCQRRKT